MIGSGAISLLVLVVVSLLAWAGLTQALGPRSHVLQALEPYRTAPAGTESGRRGTATGANARGVVRRAVGATERAARRARVLDRVGRQLVRADVALPPAEAILIVVVVAVVAALSTAAVTRSALAGLLAVPVAVLAPLAWLRRRATRRRASFGSQLPDTLQLLAASLKAGHSLPQGLQIAAEESPDPTGAELRLVLRRSSLGMAMVDALDEMADRLDNVDWDYAVVAVRIQQEVGGNLAELLASVASTIRLRERLRREVAALTAEGRLSAIAVALLPLGLALIMSVVNPDYMRPLFTEAIGRVVLGASGVLAVLGYLWTRAIVRIEA